MTAQEPMIATVNQMMPLSGQPNRFSLHMESNAQTTQVRPRSTIIHRLKSYYCKLWFHSLYLLLDGFEFGVLPFGCVVEPV